MDTLIVYPDNKEQLMALMALMKAMNVNFEQAGNVYPDDVSIGVKQSLKQASEGKLTLYKGIKQMLEV